MTLIHLPDPTNDDLPICLNGGKLMGRVFVESVGGNRANCSDCKDGGRKPVLKIVAPDMEFDVYPDRYFEDMMRFEAERMSRAAKRVRAFIHA